MGDDETFMEAALKEALAAESEGNYAVGAVAVKDGKIIARAHNLTVTRDSVFNHAEYLLMDELDELGYADPNSLRGITVYVTLAPCPMCWGKMLVGGVPEVVIGAPDDVSAADFSYSTDMFKPPKVRYLGGELGTKCKEVFLRSRGAIDEKFGYTAGK